MAGLARPRRETDERGDLAAVEGSKLGQLGEQGARDGGPDPRNGDEQILLVAPDRRIFDALVDVAVEAVELALQRLEQAENVLFDARRRVFLALLSRAAARRRSSPRSAAAGEETGRVSSSRSGRISRAVASTKWAMTAASIGSVLALLPSALAYVAPSRAAPRPKNRSAGQSRLPWRTSFGSPRRIR
jgi:hypothetical protein